MSPLLSRLVGLSGLSPIFAETAVRRAVARAGIDPDAIQRLDLEKALPEIERALIVYLGAETAKVRAEQIRAGLAA